MGESVLGHPRDQLAIRSNGCCEVSFLITGPPTRVKKPTGGDLTGAVIKRARHNREGKEGNATKNQCQVFSKMGRGNLLASEVLPVAERLYRYVSSKTEFGKIFNSSQIRSCAQAGLLESRSG